jgi:Holliday junction resolvase RusA-like endonuclease
MVFRFGVSPPLATYMQSLEILIDHRPVSVHKRDRAGYRRWMGEVQTAAARSMGGTPFGSGSRLTLFYLYHGQAIDVDNVIKPIADALSGVAYEDDGVLSDVESHRRLLGEPLVVSSLPPLLQRPWLAMRECVYIRVDHPPEIER